jgi:hypothetical protein
MSMATPFLPRAVLRYDGNLKVADPATVTQGEPYGNQPVALTLGGAAR